MRAFFISLALLAAVGLMMGCNRERPIRLYTVKCTNGTATVEAVSYHRESRGGSVVLTKADWSAVTFGPDCFVTVAP